MTLIHFERGRIIKARPSIVLCILENPDIGDAIQDRTFKSECIREGYVSGERG